MKLIPFILASIAFWSAPLVAQIIAPEVKKDDAPAADTAILDLDLPKGSNATLDGKDIGAQQRFTFTGLTENKWSEHRLAWTDVDGKKVERPILLQGGWRVKFPVNPVAGVELVTQASSGGWPLAFSSDGKRFLTRAARENAVLWDVAPQRKLRTFRIPGKVPSAATFHPDGKHVVIVHGDMIVLWELASGRRVQLNTIKEELNIGCVPTPDGKHFVGLRRGGNDGDYAELRESATSKLVHDFNVRDLPLAQGLWLSPDGKHMLVRYSYPNCCIVWDVQTGAKRRTIDGITWVSSSPFSPDGKQIVARPNGTTAIVWDWESGEKRMTIEGKETDFIEDAMFTADGKHIIIRNHSSPPVIWDSQTGRKVRELTRIDPIPLRGLLSMPDSRRLLSIDYKGAIQWWDAATGTVLPANTGQCGGIVATAISPDGRGLLAASIDSLMLWDMAVGRTKAALKGHKGSATSVAFSPDNAWALSGSKSFEGNSPSVVLWDARTGAKFKEVTSEFSVNDVAFTADSKHLLAGYDLHRALLSTSHTALWEVATGKSVRTYWSHKTSKFGTFPTHDGHVLSLAVGPDRKQFITGGDDGTAIIWDTETSMPLHVLPVGVEDPAFELLQKEVPLPKSGLLGGEPRFINPVESVAYGPTGKYVATMSSGGIKIWDPQIGKKVAEYKCHSGGVSSIGFRHGNDEEILTVGRDDTPVFRQTVSGRTLQTFTGPVIGSAKFHPDGRHILTGSPDGVLRIWDIATGEELADFVSLDGGNDWLATTPAGLFDGSPGGREKVSYRVGGGLNVVPVDRFFQDFYRPGLLSSIWKGDRPVPESKLGEQKPPTIKILSPKESGISDKVEVVIDAEVTDEGGGISGPWLVHNGMRIRTENKSSRHDNKLIRSFSLLLAPGENRLEVRAASADGSWESEPATVSLKYQKLAEKVVLHVLAVGINKYAESSLNLKYAAVDAKEVAGLFEKRGANLFRATRIHLLADADATQANIQRDVKAIAQEAKPEDVLVVFLAGHGTAIGQRYYYVTHEFKRSDAATVDEDVRKQALAGDVLASWLEDIHATKRIVIFDTCQSGAALGLKAGGRNPFAFQGAIETLQHANGAHTIAAAAAGEEAREIEELGHGLLTYTLLAGMKAVERGPLADKWIKPSNTEEVIDVFEWFQYANGNVPKIAEKYYKARQNVSVNCAKDIFPVLPIK